MRQLTEWALIRAMACRLFGAKPSPEPVLVYYQFDFCKHISVKLESEFNQFQENASKIAVWQTGGHFVLGEMSKMLLNSKPVSVTQ